MPRTPLPSVSLVFGEQAFIREDFDFTKHGGGAELLRLPAASYARVLLSPFGLAQAGRQYEIDLAYRFIDNLNRFQTMFSLAGEGGLIQQLVGRGKDVTVYLPGWFASNATAWRRLMHPAMYAGRRNFNSRLDELWQWFRRGPTAWWCGFCYDASGGPKTLTDIDAMAIAYGDSQGQRIETEGHPGPTSPLYLNRSSITTAWSALESPSGDLAPAARRAILCSNTSGIGNPAGCYSAGPPARPIGPFGRDHRQNFVPEWRDQGRTIFVPVHDIAPDGTPPAFWNATTRDPIPAPPTP